VTVVARAALAYDPSVRIVSSRLALFLATVASVGACSSPGAAVTPDAAPATEQPDASTPALWTTEPACTATAADVYTTPALPPLTPAMRGDIVRCALGELLTEAEAEEEMHG
jgi:hypothetical protein